MWASERHRRTAGLNAIHFNLDAHAPMQGTVRNPLVHLSLYIYMYKEEQNPSCVMTAHNGL